MSEVIRYSALYAEEDPNGSLVGTEAIKELEAELASIYKQDEELYEAAERLARACETTNHGKRVADALANFREVTGG